MNGVMMMALTQFLSQAPTLIVYCLGIVLALVFWRRYPRPCLLTLIATGLLLLMAIISAGVQIYLFNAISHGWPAARYGSVMGAISIAMNFIHAGASGLLLVAVFSGRSSRPPIDMAVFPGSDRAGNI